MVTYEGQLAAHAQC